MALFAISLTGLRNDPRLLKLPPFFSLICILVGICWLLVIPLDQYSRRTYVSENALLPGQVNTYFGGSEHQIFRSYRHEVAALYSRESEGVAHQISKLFESQGLNHGIQKYSYKSAGNVIQGHNTYAILQGPRADATEAIVLIAAWKNTDNVPNNSGVALVLTLAQYFKRWSLWSKDIIFVITGDSTAGPQAWVDAYHSTHNPELVDDLSIKAGALQGALALDYTAGVGGHRFEKVHVVYDGINGQLPNLDLFNTVVSIAERHMGMDCMIQKLFHGRDWYIDRLKIIARGMVTQGLGHASGPHSSFIPYHVDAVTLRAVGDGWLDEMGLGRLVESTFRSLNNLLEHLHQSFFLYLLMHPDRFVSIATYLPSAMLIAINFTIMSIALWVQSGRMIPVISPATIKEDVQKPPEDSSVEVLEQKGEVAVLPKSVADTSNRSLFFAISFITAVTFLGLAPLYFFNTLSEQFLRPAFYVTTLVSGAIPFLASKLIQTQTKATPQTQLLIPSVSLLILGIALSTLSTLNFALGFFTSLLSSPLSFVGPITLPNQQSLTPLSTSSATQTNTTTTTTKTSKTDKKPADTEKSKSVQQQKLLTAAYIVFLYAVSPTTIIYAASFFMSGNSADGRDGLTRLLVEAATAWTVSGTWTSVVVWLVWWPAWVVGVSVGFCGLLQQIGKE